MLLAELDAGHHAPDAMSGHHCLLLAILVLPIHIARLQLRRGSFLSTGRWLNRTDFGLVGVVGDGLLYSP